MATKKNKTQEWEATKGWLQTHVPAATTKEKHASLKNQFNVIDFMAICECLCRRGYKLDENSSFQSKVKNEEEAAWAGFQLTFYAKLSEPYGYPHIIKIRARENGTRSVAIESCFDYARKSRGCVLALKRLKFNHRQCTTTKIITGLRALLRNAVNDPHKLYLYKDFNLSQLNISKVLEQVNDYCRHLKMNVHIKRTDLMASWKGLHEDGRILRRIHKTTLLGSGTERNMYNMILAFNRLIINRKLGDKKNPMVYQEDAAWEIMTLVMDAALTLYRSRETEVATKRSVEKHIAALAFLESLKKKTKTQLQKMYVSGKINPMTKALLWQIMINKA